MPPEAAKPTRTTTPWRPLAMATRSRHSGSNLLRRAARPPIGGHITLCFKALSGSMSRPSHPYPLGPASSCSLCRYLRSYIGSAWITTPLLRYAGGAGAAGASLARAPPIALGALICALSMYINDQSRQRSRLLVLRVGLPLIFIPVSAASYDGAARRMRETNRYFIVRPSRSARGHYPPRRSRSRE